jgi:glycerol-3-phosphate O-acyltransferase
VAIDRSLVGAVAAAVAAAVALAAAAYARRAGRRALWQHRGHVASHTLRHKLRSKAEVQREVLQDPRIADAVRAHAAEHAQSVEETWARVHRYLDEIVPSFNVLAYYRLGRIVSRAVLGVFYKVSVAYERDDPFRGLPRDATVIYLMNHRSNADYVLVAYVLLGEVSISYAVGEWARAFPLEYVFKHFGSYFIRRRFREPLYHTVLRCYVELITARGVTQGIFPEGGLTRDGLLRTGKVGLLDYALQAARDPSVRDRLYVVPVAINYDRVLEDRSLLRELEASSDRPVTSRAAQLREVGRFLVFNVTRVLLGRWRRYGRAAVTVGSPIAVAPWLEEFGANGVSFFDLPRADRLGAVQSFVDRVLQRVGELIPVTSVPLTCAALESFDGEYVSRSALLERMRDLRDVLQELNGRVVRGDQSIEEVFDRAYRMLRMRRVIARAGDGFLVLPRGRPLIRYYANSVAPLLGAYTTGARAARLDARRLE